jgi:hypothetical protein
MNLIVIHLSPVNNLISLNPATAPARPQQLSLRVTTNMLH